MAVVKRGQFGHSVEIGPLHLIRFDLHYHTPINTDLLGDLTGAGAAR
jgi:hypothetical protein